MLANGGLSRALLRVALTIFALFLAYRFLTAVATVALSLAAGLLLAVALSGPVEALRRRKVPRSLALALMLLGALLLLLLALGGLVLLPTLSGEISRFTSTIPGALSDFTARVEGLAKRLGVPFPEDTLSLSSVRGTARQVFGGAVGVFGPAVSALGSLVVVAFLTLYLVVNPDPAVRWVVRLFPPGHRPRARGVLSALRSGLLDWLKGQLASMVVIGSLWSVALLLLGVPGALLLGLFAALAAFVPYLGPLIALVPAFLLAFAAGPLTALLVVVVYLAIQTAESYLITPLIMERAASVHPAAVIAAVAVLGAAFGALGALLAVPATVAGGILVEELWFRRLEPGATGGDGEKA